MMMRIRPLALLIGLLLTSAPAVAQNPFSAARFVNDGIITHYDISQRTRMLRAFGVAPGDAEDLALKQLTEDSLKARAATDLGIFLTDEGYENSLEEFVTQRQMSVGGLNARLRNGGVAPETFEYFLRTSLRWREVINRRYRQRATPSEADVENELNFAAGRIQESVFIREIAIPFAERGQDGARALARQIVQQVEGGASFAALARRYSRTPTAENGGAVGWTPANRLPPLFASNILALSKGEVSAPIEVPAGIVLVQLSDIREETSAAAPDVSMSYVRMDLPLAGGFGETSLASAMAEIPEMADSFDTCTDAEARAAQLGGASGRFGPVTVAEMDPDLAMVIAGLDAGELGAMPPTEASLPVIMLCNRTLVTDPEEFDGLRDRLFGSRMASYAESYIQELLADAVIVDK